MVALGQEMVLKAQAAILNVLAEGRSQLNGEEQRSLEMAEKHLANARERLFGWGR